MSDSRFNLICGVDEAGRGPLAGPVFAACVVLNPAHKIEGLSDSKKLSVKKRNALTHIIKTNSMAWAIASASVEEIDQLNILQASLLAMKRAVESLPFTPDKVLVDGSHSPRLDLTVPLHKSFPNYGFDQHKGYPTKKHIVALQVHGISAVHRRSFSPVRKLILHRCT